MLAVVTGSALIGFWRFPTAPPRLLTGGGFHDTLAAYGSWGWWGRLTSRRWLRALAIAYPVLTALVVLGAPNHYLTAVVAGAGLWLLADLGCGTWHGRR